MDTQPKTGNPSELVNRRDSDIRELGESPWHDSDLHTRGYCTSVARARTLARLSDAILLSAAAAP